MLHTPIPHLARTKLVAGLIITIFTLAGCRSSLLAPAPVDFAKLDRIRTLAGVRIDNDVSLFGEPFGIAVATDDTIFVTDGERGCVWAIDERGATRKVASDLATPSGVVVAPDGSLVVAETGAHVIRRLDPQDGTSHVIAGLSGAHGFADGNAEAARFDAPVGVAVDAAGVIYVADTYNDRIRRIDRAGNVSTIAGGDGHGYADADNGIDARFHTPCNLALRGADTLIVADTGNHRLRQINLTSPTYGVTTLAGTGESAIRDGTLDAAAFDEPIGLVFAHDGALLVTDAGGDALRRITFVDVNERRDNTSEPQSATAPVVTTINRAALTPADDARAYARTAGFLDGELDSSLARRPSGIGVTRRGRIVFADSHNRVVRLITEADADIGEEASSDQVFALLPDAASLRRAGAPRWAFDPADRPREIAATFGEVRGVIEMGKQAWWHNGLDIPGALGETVRFVRSEIVLLPLAVEGTGSARERLRLPTLGYIHVRIGRTHDDKPLLEDDRFRFALDEQGRTREVRVRRGTRFEAGEPVGTLNNQYHVHLIAGAPGAEVNALAALELPGIQDTLAPTIVRDGVRFERFDGEVYTNVPGAAHIVIDADARIVARAYDQMNGGAARRRLGVYALDYQVLAADGTEIEGDDAESANISFERLPEAAQPSIVYAEPSRAGYTPETFFDYIVTNRVRDREGSEDVWRASRLAPGDYIVRIIARDFFGNQATEDFRVRLERRS